MSHACGPGFQGTRFEDADEIGDGLRGCRFQYRDVARECLQELIPRIYLRVSTIPECEMSTKKCCRRWVQMVMWSEDGPR